MECQVSEILWQGVMRGQGAKMIVKQYAGLKFCGAGSMRERGRGAVREGVKELLSVWRCLQANSYQKRACNK